MEDGSLEFKAYLSLFLRWWWLFSVAATGAGGAAYYATSSIIPVYESRAQIVVERQGRPGITSAADFDESASLAQNYVGLVKRRPILQMIAQNLPVSISPGAVGSKIEVSSRRNILHITATDRDPVLAAILANTAAETFIKTQLDRQLSQLAQFQEVLGQYGIRQETDIVAIQAAMVGILSIVEPAVPTSSPSNGGQLIRNVLIAAVMGLLIAGLAVVLIEYLDGRVRSPDELKAVTGLSPMGSIPRFKSRNGKFENAFNNSQGLGYVSESFNALHTNIDFASPNGEPIQTLLVTSSLMKEGKSVTAANLAISIAREGKSVILLDADLRSASLHEFFDLGNSKGLTDVMRGDATLEDVMASTDFEGLRVVGVGSSLVDPPVILRSDQFRTVMQQLKVSADILVIDSAPVLPVADSLVLASESDGVLLVVDARRTKRATVNQALARLNQVNPRPRFIGAVLNKVKTDRRSSHYLDYSRKKSSLIPRSKAQLLFTRFCPSLGVLTLAVAIGVALSLVLVVVLGLINFGL